MVTVTGYVKPIKRIITGFYSFDKAFMNQKGEIGFPIGKITEIFGATHVGKSTITYGLSGIIAKETAGNIALLDLEDFDPDFLTTILETAGFTGEIKAIIGEDDETALDNLLKQLKTPEFTVGILDAVGAISPISERQGELGEANMGRRAYILAQFFRKAIYILRTSDKYKSLFVINHQYPKIGGFGVTVPGGKIKNFLSSIRIQVKRLYRKNKEETFPDGSYVIQGTIKKNRWGYRDKNFYLFVISGMGIDKNITAVFDTIQLGIAKQNRTISLGDKSFGYLRDIIDRARQKDDEFFIPFFEALNSYEVQ